MKEKKKIIGLVSAIVVLIIVIVGVSYAWLTMTVQGNEKQVLRVGGLRIILNETNSLTISDARPISDSEGMAQDGFIFSVENQGALAADYNVYLDDDTIETNKTRLDDQYVKYSLDVNDTTGTAKTLSNRLIYSGHIERNTTDNFVLRVWLNDEIDGYITNQVFKVKLRVEVNEETAGSKMKAYTSNSTDDYHSNTYKTKVTSIVTKSNTEVPETAIESWDVSEAGDGSVIAYVEDDGSGGTTYKVTIGGENGIAANENSSYLFANFNNVTSIDLSSLDTSNATTIAYMFYKCNSLTNINFGEKFDTSQVTDMVWLFYQCSSLTEIDFGKHFNTSKVTVMNLMFFGCSKLTELDLSGFNTSQVTNMNGMFSNCSSLNSLNLSSFDTSQVTNMSTMFSNCSSLNSLNLSSFDTSKVTNMGSMFDNCRKLTKLDLSSFNGSNVTYLGSMFSSCSSLVELDMRNFGVPKTSNYTFIFTYCRQLTNIIIGESSSSWVTSAINSAGINPTLTTV